MRTIWKFKIELEDYTDLDIPESYQILAVKLQNGLPYIWVLLDPENKPKKVRLRLVGTGHEIKEPNLKYVNTFFVKNGEFVFHLFEICDGAWIKQT